MTMRRRPAFAAALALAVTPALAAGPPPPGAVACGGCHAQGAAADAPPPLLGRPAADIAGRFEAFRSGAAAGTIMPRLARGFAPDEIAAIAAWLAAQPAR